MGIFDRFTGSKEKSYAEQISVFETDIVLAKKRAPIVEKLLADYARRRVELQEDIVLGTDESKAAALLAEATLVREIDTLERERNAIVSTLPKLEAKIVEIRQAQEADVFAQEQAKRVTNAQKSLKALPGQAAKIQDLLEQVRTIAADVGLDLDIPSRDAITRVIAEKRNWLEYDADSSPDRESPADRAYRLKQEEHEVRFSEYEAERKADDEARQREDEKIWDRPRTEGNGSARTIFHGKAQDLRWDSVERDWVPITKPAASAWAGMPKLLRGN